MTARRNERLGARGNGREEVASALLAEALESPRDHTMPALIVDDHGGLAEAALEGTRPRAQTWRRWALRLAAPEERAIVHAPGPPAGPFARIALRLPRDWASFEMQLHLAAARLVPEGRLLVVGATDEGIKSAPRRIEALFKSVEPVVNKRRMRVLEARGLRAEITPQGEVEDWREEVDAGAFSMVSYPGVFAEGRLDDGSALLLDALARTKVEGHVLDFGCGHGMLARALSEQSPSASYTLLDVDALALHAARQNLPNACGCLSDAWLGLEAGERFDLIVSNPPIHRGRDVDFSALQDLVVGAPGRLSPGGRLVLVTHRTVGTGRLLGAHFSSVSTLAETPRFQVWVARS
jgi:16S rRNA (guanine1207-N2)-methyltransferase